MGGSLGDPPPTGAIAYRLAPLFFTHINQALLTTLPFAVAVYMVRDFEAARSGGAAVSEQAVGRATGLLAAVFCAAQLLTSFPWGLVSDRIGRKPVMVVGNVSCVVSVLLFGLSGSYWQAVGARAVGGALNAVILVEKAMIGEGLPCNDSQAKAFGLMSLCWGLGSLAGPAVGGALSAPCSSGLRIQALCGEGSLLVHRPYFLPCLLAGVLSAIATIMTIVGLEETLPSRRTAAPAPGRAGGGGGKARYEAVPTADAGEAAAPGGLGEVELGGLRRQDSSQGGGLWGGSDGGDGGSPGKAPCGGRDKGRPFRGDSARIRAAWGQPSPPPPAPGSDAGSGAGSRRGSSRGSLGSLEADVVVLGPGDLEQGQERQEQGRLLAGGATAAEAASEAAPAQAAAPAADLPWYRQRTVVLSLLGYGLIAFVFNMLDEVTPIFASAEVSEGGLGFAPSQLAPSLSFGGLVLVCWALLGFPWLMRRVGVVKALRLGLWQTAPLALLIPAASLFRGGALPSQALMLLCMGAKAVTATNAFTSCLILVNASAPRAALGAVNGTGQSLASFVRALGPALGGLSWGWSHQLAAAAWWPAWLPPQFMPFAAAATVLFATDAVYRGLRLPDADEPGGGGGRR